ncbi:MAG: hypothetical protein H6Q25_36 [Bacteroidetes bacterium]|nr:hypothetical protein [Bacteroidota bacterium]
MPEPITNAKPLGPSPRDKHKNVKIKIIDMKKNETLFCLVLITTLFISCSNNLSMYQMKKQDQKEDKELTKKLSKIPVPTAFLGNEKDSLYLKTGWYMVTDDPTKGVPKEIIINGQNQTIYIDPFTQISVKDIEFIYLVKDPRVASRVNIMMYFNEIGTEKWSVLTEKSLRKQLAFIINNVVVSNPMVQSQITNGISLFDGADYTPEEMFAIKRVLESQKNEK